MFNWLKQKLKRAWKWILGIVGGGAVAIALTIPNGAVPTDNNRAIGSDEVVLPGEESLFAEFDADGNVLRVIVIDADVLNTGKWDDPKNWVRTYADGRKRGNYAGKGYKFDKDLDGFIPPRPSLDHTLDKTNFKWISPVVEATPFNNPASQ